MSCLLLICKLYALNNEKKFNLNFLVKKKCMENRNPAVKSLQKFHKVVVMIDKSGVFMAVTFYLKKKGRKFHSL